MKLFLNILKKIALAVAGILLLLMLFIFLFFQIPAIQNFVAGKVVNMARQKLETELELGKIAIIPPNKVRLKDIYVEGTKGDTLLFAEEISAGIALFKLFSKKIELNSLQISSTTANIIRDGPDSSFNFSFIPKDQDREKPMKEKTSSKWSFDIDRIYLDNLRFTFNDRNLDNSYSASLGELRIRIRSFVPDPLKIIIRSVRLSESDIRMELQTKASRNNKKEESGFPEIGLSNDIELEKINFQLIDKPGGQQVDLENLNLYVSSENIDLPNKQIFLDQIQLNNTSASFLSSGEESVEEIPQQESDSSSFLWKIRVSDLSLKNNSFSYHNKSKPVLKGFDPANLEISGVSADIGDLLYSKDSLHMKINELAMKEGEDFVIDNLSGQITAGHKYAEIENFLLETPGSHLQMQLSADSFNYTDLKNSLQRTYFNLALYTSHISTDDLTYFYPGFPEHQYGKATDMLFFRTEMAGRLSDLTIHDFRADINDKIILTLEGDISGLPEMDQLRGNLFIDSVYLAGDQIRNYLPDSLIPESISVPENFLVQARTAGSTDLSNSSINIRSAAGGIQAEIRLQTDSTDNKEYFQVEAGTGNLDLGRILKKQDTLGTITMNLALKGSTTDFKDPEAKLDLQVDTLRLIEYPYTNLHVEGNFTPNQFMGTAKIDDENIRFNFDGKIDLSDTIPDTNFSFELKGANLMALNLTNQDIRVGGKIRSSLKGSKLDDINGNLGLHDIMVVKNGQIIEMDSLVFDASNTVSGTKIKATSPLLEASYDGSVKPSEVTSKLWSHLNLFFAFEEKEPEKPEIPDNFVIDMQIKDHPMISEILLPGIVNFRGIDLTLDYNENNEDNILNSEINISPLHYNDTYIDSIQIDVNSRANIFQVEVNSGGLSQDPVLIPGLIVNSRLGNDTASWSFEIEDQENEKKYNISGTLDKKNDFIRAKFNPGDLVLNHQNWSLPEDNSILFSGDTVIFNNLRFQRENQELLVSKNTEGQDMKGTRIEFTSFKLETLTRIISTENILGGKVNGKIILGGNKKGFIAEMQIADLTSYGEELFNMVAMKADQTEDDIIIFRGQFQDGQERIRLMGSYVTEVEKHMDIDIYIEQLELQSFQPLLSEQFKTLQGKINGQLKVTGPTEDMELSGEISMDEGRVAPRALGTTFKSGEIQLAIQDKDLIINDFSISDPGGNEASIEGSIQNFMSQSPILDIQVNAEDFTWLNSSEGTNEMFYGKITNDLSAQVTGRMKEPEIELETTITGNTDFHFIVPSQDNATIEREGLVVFVQDAKDTSSILFSGLEDKDIEVTPNRNINLTAEIEVEEEAVLNVIIDPASRENLTIRGSANLNFSMSEGGRQSLTGQYIINEGSYNLTLYDVIRRKFTIEEGSSLTWSGDIMGAQADIAAIYRVRTSPEGLIASEISGMNEEQRRQISRSIPFQVVLNINGELLSPELDFDISTPPGTSVPEVTSKLNQLNQNQSEVNKQAFALLTFGSFIQNQVSTAHPVSYEINSAARTSISRILSTQLNRLAEQYIEGIEINVDVNSYSDYTMEQPQNTTNVALDVEKQFFDERLTVQVGGKVNLEGKEQKANNMNRLAGDVKVIYDLTEEGRFKLKGFNTREYENILEGEITKTGVGIIYNRDIYNLSDLFKKWKYKDEE